MYPRTYHGCYQATNAWVTKQAERDNREALRRFLHGWKRVVAHTISVVSCGDKVTKSD
jgi:hypothetical protein